MRKGVSREIINFVILLILVTLFLALVIIFFSGMADEVAEKLRSIFHVVMKK